MIIEKDLRDILREEYSEPTVKKIMTPNKRYRIKPSYEKMLLLWREHSIPLEAWEDIRAWLKEPYADNPKRADSQKQSLEQGGSDERLDDSVAVDKSKKIKTNFRKDRKW